tara:strand:+ start:13722 stop:14132 length:411 start_codon:yes stop_codon:yes gene_type:complete
MRFLKINRHNLNLLEHFVSTMGEASKSFRYFEKHNPREVVHNHLVTYLLYHGSSVAYGHLDVEDDIVWLGICVKPSYQGKGYGKTMMEKLIKSTTKPIQLSVDKENKRAISLYEKLGFNIFNEGESIFYMKHDTNI